MFLAIDKAAEQPVYQQIRDGIIALIKSGALATGDKLPGTRDLAAQLGVSRKTVIVAYIELTADNWVESRPGSSTYVLDRSGSAALLMRRSASADAADAGAVAGGAEMDWSQHQLDGSYFNIPPYRSNWTGADEWISFSRAIPDARLFPFERIKKVSSQMLWDPKAYFFDYGHPQGYVPLMEYLSTRLVKDGVDMTDGKNDIVIASGFQVSLSLLLNLLLKPGDAVAVEDPTFNSILNLLSARQAAVRGIPMEHDGLDLQYLERVIRRDKPRLLITIPTLHNPTGVTMSREKRGGLIALAQKHGLPIIEDNWSMLLGYEGRREPSLKTLDSGGHVIQIGSFSKSFLPGTRVGWIILPGELGVSLVKAKRALDRSDSYFLQTLVHEFIMKGYMDLHCRKMDRIYRARLELTDELMRQHFPSAVSWKRPAGGFTFWVKLPGLMSAEALLQSAVAAGLDFAPGSYFSVGRKDSQYFRLAFSTLTQPQLRQGIRRLGRVIEQEISKGAGPNA